MVFMMSKKNFWQTLTWQQVLQQIKVIRTALSCENINKGDCVAIMLRNCPEWVMFDLAAQSLGLITVPLYTNDRAENVAYIIEDAGVKLLLIQNQRQWRELSKLSCISKSLQRVISVEEISDAEVSETQLLPMQAWLDNDVKDETDEISIQAEELATIVYTSGTTGRPKGVMLSHKNILTNAYAALQCGEFYDDDVFLSFLPLSHTLERTAGCFLPMMSNSTVYFCTLYTTISRRYPNSTPNDICFSTTNL